MPIQVACSSCSGRFRVPDNVAGKKIRCPKCKEVIQVPAAGGSEAPSAPATPSTPEPTPPASQPKPAATKSAARAVVTPAAKPIKPAPENWFLKTEDGESYGPVPRAELDAWYAEGRVTVDCQVLREGSEQWQWASQLYPALDAGAAEAAAAAMSDAAESPVVEPGPVAEKSEVKSSATPSATEDNPFSFLGGSGDAGGEAFSFSAKPATQPATGKAGKKAIQTAAAPVAAAAGSEGATDGGEVSSKSKLTAGLLAIFLGSLGVHRFYLGYTVLGVVQLLLCGGCGIWQIIDIVLIFTGKLPDAQGRPLKD